MNHRKRMVAASSGASAFVRQRVATPLPRRFLSGAGENPLTAYDEIRAGIFVYLFGLMV